MNNLKIINQKNIMHNIKIIKKYNISICAMIKANAYGHGMENIIKAINKEVYFFGVANENEALKAKKIAQNSNILIVGKTFNFTKIINKDISFTIDSLKELLQALTICKKNNRQAKVHIAVNTGMNRLGLSDIDEFKKMLNVVNENNYHLKLEGVFTHCFDVDCSKTHFYSQMQRFYEFVRLVKTADTIIHIGGSCVLIHKVPKFINMVRVGYFLYGYGKSTLKPVMELRTRVIKVNACKSGEFISYGNKIKLDRDSKIAVLPIGYADGIPRCISNKYEVIINGKKAKIIGNICMDMFMIDVTDIPCKLGDEVIVFNNAVKIAKQAQTSPYEILTNLNSFRGKSLIV